MSPNIPASEKMTKAFSLDFSFKIINNVAEIIIATIEPWIIVEGLEIKMIKKGISKITNNKPVMLPYKERIIAS